MSNEMIPQERREQIANRLLQGQRVMAASLALEFGVSEDVIRRDLRQLAAQGRCKRVYGGALPLDGRDKPLRQRQQEGVANKLALARCAVTSIQPGQMLFLDNGSSNFHLAQLLPIDYQLTVVTNSLPIANVLLDREDIELIVLGGIVSQHIGGAVDGGALKQLSLMRFDCAFMGACAVSSQHGVAVFDQQDALFKRQLLRNSAMSVVLVTLDKLDQAGRFHVASLSEISQLIVEDEVEPSALAALQLACPLVSKAGPVRESV